MRTECRELAVELLNVYAGWPTEDELSFQSSTTSTSSIHIRTPSSDVRLNVQLQLVGRRIFPVMLKPQLPASLGTGGVLPHVWLIVPSLAMFVLCNAGAPVRLALLAGIVPIVK